MKRKITLTLIIFLIGIISLIILAKDKKIIKNNINNKNINFISMMVEDEEGDYIEQKDINFPKDNYLFNPEKSGCENGGTLSWNEEKGKVEASLLTSDKCYAYFDKYSFEKDCRYGYKDNAACTVVKFKDNSLIYHDEKCDFEGESNCDLEAGDLSYRFTGIDSKVNNYICFGSDDETCPEENLYRIIGLFLNSQNEYELKIIKADYTTTNHLGANGSYSGLYMDGSAKPKKDVSLDNYLGDKDNFYPQIGCYIWNQDKNPNWAESNLNKINLNDYYFNTYLGKNNSNSKWQNFIVKHDWQIGGNGYGQIEYSKVKIAFENEILHPKNDIKESAYIGLMYVSDYDYAVDSSAWQNTSSGLKNAKDLNWLNMGLYEWTITTTTDGGVLSTMSQGGIWAGDYANSCFAIRPAMYLKANTHIIDGNGNKNTPFRLG